MNAPLSLNILLALAVLAQVSLAIGGSPLNDWEKVELAASVKNRGSMANRCHRYFSILEKDEPMTADELKEYLKNIKFPRDFKYEMNSNVWYKLSKIVQAIRPNRREESMRDIYTDLDYCLLKGMAWARQQEASSLGL